MGLRVWGLGFSAFTGLRGLWLRRVRVGLRAWTERTGDGERLREFPARYAVGCLRARGDWV